MKILALDTATEACSAALLIDGEVTERYRLAPREHNRIILPMIQELLADSDCSLSMIDAIGFGCGPGSFTGIRIATGVVQGLALGLDIPVAPISTLAALAFEAMNECDVDQVHASIDARMAQVYWGTYQRGVGDTVSLVGLEQVICPDQVIVETSLNDVGIGSGWMTYSSVLLDRLGRHDLRILEDRFPRAAFISRLAASAFASGVALPPEDVEPVYLRNDVAKKPGAHT